jgi:hypothetical protein
MDITDGECRVDKSSPYDYPDFRIAEEDEKYIGRRCEISHARFFWGEEALYFYQNTMTVTGFQATEPHYPKKKQGPRDAQMDRWSRVTISQVMVGPLRLRASCRCECQRAVLKTLAKPEPVRHVGRTTSSLIRHPDEVFSALACTTLPAKK